MKKFIIISIVSILFLGVLPASAVERVRGNDRAVAEQRDRIDKALDRLETLNIASIAEEVQDLRDRNASMTTMQEAREVSRDIKSLRDNVRIGIVSKKNDQAKKVLMRRSELITLHLEKLKEAGRNTTEAENLMDQANQKISALDADTMDNLREEIKEIYALFGAIAKTIK